MGRGGSAARHTVGEGKIGVPPMRPLELGAERQCTMWARCGWCGSAYRSATRRATPETGICWGCLRDEFPELVKISEGDDRPGDGEPRAA